MQQWQFIVLTKRKLKVCGKTRRDKHFLLTLKMNFVKNESNNGKTIKLKKGIQLFRMVERFLKMHCVFMYLFRTHSLLSLQTEKKKESIKSPQIQHIMLWLGEHQDK